MFAKGVYIKSNLNIYSNFGGCIGSIQASICSCLAVTMRVKFLPDDFGDINDLLGQIMSLSSFWTSMSVFSPVILSYFPKVVLKSLQKLYWYHTVILLIL